MTHQQIPVKHFLNVGHAITVLSQKHDTTGLMYGTILSQNNLRA